MIHSLQNFQVLSNDASQEKLFNISAPYSREHKAYFVKFFQYAEQAIL